MSLRKKRLALHKNRDKNNKKKSNVILAPPDNMLIAIIIALIVFGSLAIFSAGAPDGLDVYHNPAYYVIKHILFVALGCFLMIKASRFDYRYWKELAVLFSIITIVLIVATFIPGIGKISHGSSRWLVGLPIQPSELAKIGSIFLIASALVHAKSLFDKKLLKHLFLILIMIALIFKQPNLSISMIIAFVTAAMMLVAGVSHLLLSGIIITVIPFIYAHILSTPYQLKRITGWLKPWEDPQGTGYNLIQSLYAIGSGGILGAGFGNSKQKLFWLPFRHTDFIFAVIAEEFGLIGGIILIGIFLAFIYRGFLIANKCPDMFGRLIAFGITFSIGLQAFINIGVAVGVLPITGVTLPLISYGGSSVVVTLFMLGVLLNISRKRVKKIHTQEEC
ncbi:MAG: putative lipid II flippase FtsW [Candidatus Gastranaerophilales bacterium]|nr:putative lipid II flippase FtsW [Candidatus Gastranaerophilales bacterium]